MKPVQSLRLLARGISMSSSSRQVPMGMKEAVKDMGLVPKSNLYQRVQKNQVQWIKSQEEWVWKKNIVDNFLTSVTNLACSLGVIACLIKGYSMAFPKKA